MRGMNSTVTERSQSSFPVGVGGDGRFSEAVIEQDFYILDREFI